MGPTRRTVLGVLAVSLTTGCLTGGGGDGTPSPEPGETTSTSTSTSTQGGETTTPSAGSCDPAAVTRPPIIEDANHPPQGYGTKPQELTQLSVADYLADFETAYAWNRILDEHSPVTNLGVDTTTPWEPAPAGDGFIASSRIEVSYAKEPDVTPTSRIYVASYFVSTEAVYRVETDSEAVDPRNHPDRQLVQCGGDSK